MKRFIAVLMVGLLCFFLFAPSLRVYATTVTYDYETFDSRFNPVENMPVFTSTSMASVYTADGGDFSNVTIRSTANTSYPFQNSFLDNSWWQNFYHNIPILTTISVDGVSYDVSNAYTIIYSTDTYSQTPTDVEYVNVWGPGTFQLIRDVVVSNEPFFFYNMRTDGSSSWCPWGTLPVQSVTTASSNGFYCLSVQSLYNLANAYLAFTDLPIYLPSSDNHSGFSSFTTSSTDWSAMLDCYNFNFVMAGEYFVGPNTPVAPQDSSYLELGQYFTYAGITNYFTGVSSTSVSNHIQFSYNEYMRQNPEKYILKAVYSIDVDFDGGQLNRPVDLEKKFWSIHEIPFTTIMGTSSHGVGTANSVMDLLQFEDFIIDGGTINFRDALKSYFHEITGANENYYNDNSVISYGSSNPSGGSSSFGYWVDSSYHIRDIVIESNLSIVYTGEPETESGHYIMLYDLLTGNSEVTENKSAFNYNPYEGSSIYSDKLDSNGTGTNNIGGGNATAYGGNVYINMPDGSKYEIPEASYRAVKDAWDHLIEFMDVAGENSIWGFFENAFGVLPDPVWSWILASVATITVVSTVNYVRKR